jgi:hypothetical protein
VTRSYGLRVAVHGASVRPSLMRLLADAPSIHLASLAVAAPGLPRLLVGLRRIAIVALARRLARILFALWRDGTTYQAALLPV